MTEPDPALVPDILRYLRDGWSYPEALARAQEIKRPTQKRRPK